MSERPIDRTGEGGPVALSHRLMRMVGRDQHEDERAATPLELLFDLVFVVAYGVAGNQAAHLMAEGHYGAALGGFGFAIFAITWAWINFSWFASAFDTDDWAYRLLTMVQMAGVIVLALGLPAMFHSLDEGGHIDNMVMVAGYVVMRIAMLSQWIRAAKASPENRSAATTYIWTLGIAQIGWVALALAHTSIPLFFAFGSLLLVVELAGPVVAEFRKGGTPWHADHIAERYGLLAIIALGEGIIGTVALLTSAVEEQGWSVDAVLVAIAGLGLTFGMWWIYFLVPHARMLKLHRERSFGWGYGHLVLYASIAAVGAGLHVVGYYIAGEASIPGLAVFASVAVPIALYTLSIYALNFYLTRGMGLAQGVLLVSSGAVILVSFALVAVGVSVIVGLLVLMLVHLVTVVYYEVKGYRSSWAADDKIADEQSVAGRA